METVSLTRNTSEYVLIFIVCVACAAFGVWVSLEVHMVWGLVMTALWILIAVAFAWLMPPGGPQLIIDDDGVHDLRSGVGLIPWADIEDGYIRHMRGHPFLCLVLRNSDPYVQRLNPIKRRLAKWNGSIGFTDMSISLFGLEGADPEEIEAAIRSRAAAPSAA